MKTGRHISFLATSVLACGSLFCAKVAPVAPQPQPREYAVYAAVLRAMFFDPAWRDEFGQVRSDVILQLVIMRRTSLGAPPVLAMTELGSDRALAQLAPIQSGLFQQLLRDSEISVDLENRFTLEVPVTFLSDQEVEALHSEVMEHGWDNFYARHQQAGGLLILSRVTFDNTGSTALVYAASGVENLHAGGYLVLVQCVGGQWSVARAASVWVS